MVGVIDTPAQAISRCGRVGQYSELLYGEYDIRLYFSPARKINS